MASTSSSPEVIQTGLLSLPTEIRVEIYTYVFAWLTSNGAKDDPYTTEARKRSLDCGVCRLGFRTNRYSGDKSGSPACIYRPQGPGETAMALLRTCRQIYFEACDTLYNKTLFLITNQYADNYRSPVLYSTGIAYWNQQKLWTKLGTTEDCEFLRRLGHIRIDYQLDPGGYGLALAPRIRLLKDILGSFGPERKSTGVFVRIVTRHDRHGEYPGRYPHNRIREDSWSKVADVAASIDFGCKPEVQAICEPWKVLNSDIKEVAQRLEAALV